MDYETLKFIWLILIGFLFIGFAVTGGFDLGVATLLPFIGKTDEQRRVLLNSIGPTWEGNQVWFITSGGALFAAWPFMYAASFSSFYLAFLVVLLSLILRPPGFDYRSKIPCPIWRRVWDYSLFTSGFVPSLLFGVAFGNILLGIAFHYEEGLRATPTGGFFELLSPFALLTGLVSLSALVTHGALFIQLKTTGALASRAKKAALLSAVVFIASFITAWFMAMHKIEGYQIEHILNRNELLIPTTKTVNQALGLWYENYKQYPLGFLAPILSVLGVVLSLAAAHWRLSFTALCCHALALASLLVTFGFTLYPFILPSSTNPNHGLTIWDSTSSQLTLAWMFVAAVVFVPIILGYTTWVFRVMRGKVKNADIQQNAEAY